MRLLVIHQNFPGQFVHLVRAWAQRPGWDVRGLGRDTAPGLPGLTSLTRYSLARTTRPNQHPYLRQMEAATLHGQAVARVLLQMRRNGFVPDVILAHPGWGETLYAKDVFPDSRLIHFCEWYYNADGADLNFDPEFPLTFDDRARIRTWNALHTLNLTNCDAGVTPTQWQLIQHPSLFRHKITVQHEGIACETLGPDPAARVTLPNGLVLKAGDPVITYVARNLEPYRGFHVFMRALEIIQQKHPTAHAVIVGGDGVSYGHKPKDAANWREKMLKEVRLDATRTHFLGRIPYSTYIKLLQVSAAHLYLSYPFVLSWSVLEAMACGAPVIAADTASVREVITHKVNGWTTPFDSVHGITSQVIELLEEGVRIANVRCTARESMSRLHVSNTEAAYWKLLTASPRTECARFRSRAPPQ